MSLLIVKLTKLPFVSFFHLFFNKVRIGINYFFQIYIFICSQFQEFRLHPWKILQFYVSTMKKRGNLVHTRSTKTGISCDKTPTIYTQNLWVPKIISCLFFFLFFPFLLFAIFQISIFFFPSPLFLWFCLLLSFSTNHHLLFQWNTEWCFDFVIHFILILFLFLFKFLWLNAWFFFHPSLIFCKISLLLHFSENQN